MHIDDATAFIVDFLRNPRSRHPDDRPNFGYDIWLPNVIVAYLREVEHSTEHLKNLYRRVDELSPFFYEAVWYLCRIAVFQPGIKDARGPGAADGAGADGYCVTRIGQNWLQDDAAAVFLADPDRLSQMVDNAKSLTPISVSVLYRPPGICWHDR